MGTQVKTRQVPTLEFLTTPPSPQTHHGQSKNVFAQRVPVNISGDIRSGSNPHSLERFIICQPHYQNRAGEGG